MAHPKRQTSRQRQRKRRTHFKTTIASFASCSQCQKPILSHRVCPFCGYYKQKPIVLIKPKKEKEKKA